MLIPIIYFIAAFIEIFGEFSENYNVIFYSKIILMPLLMLYVYLQTKAKGKYLFLILGLFSVLIGASIWWNLLTFSVNHFRNKFNFRGLKIINRITGIVIMLIGGAGTIISLLKQ